MRILYLHQFFITREGVGGTRSYEFARRFAARGHGVRMVTAGSGRREQEGIEVVGVRGAYSDYMTATALSSPGRSPVSFVAYVESLRLMVPKRGPAM